MFFYVNNLFIQYLEKTMQVKLFVNQQFNKPYAGMVNFQRSSELASSAEDIEFKKAMQKLVVTDIKQAEITINKYITKDKYRVRMLEQIQEIIEKPERNVIARVSLANLIDIFFDYKDSYKKAVEILVKASKSQNRDVNGNAKNKLFFHLPFSDQARKEIKHYPDKGLENCYRDVEEWQEVYNSLDNPETAKKTIKTYSLYFSEAPDYQERLLKKIIKIIDSSDFDLETRMLALEKTTEFRGESDVVNSLEDECWQRLEANKGNVYPEELASMAHEFITQS
jgi:hypothetical protein